MALLYIVPNDSEIIFFSHFGYKLICDWFMFSRDLSWNQITGPIPSNKVADNMTTLYVNNPTFIYLFCIYNVIGFLIYFTIFIYLNARHDKIEFDVLFSFYCSDLSNNRLNGSIPHFFYPHLQKL